MRLTLNRRACIRLALFVLVAALAGACTTTGRSAFGSSRVLCTVKDYACIRCFEPYNAAEDFCKAPDAKSYCAAAPASQTRDCKFFNDCDSRNGRDMFCKPGGALVSLLCETCNSVDFLAPVSAFSPGSLSFDGGSVTPAARARGGAPRFAVDLASGRVFAADDATAAAGLQEAPRVLWNGAATALITDDPGAGWRQVAHFRPELLRRRLRGEALRPLGADGELRRGAPTAAKRGLTEFAAPGYEGFPSGIATGPDGNLWVTVPSHDRIVKLTPTGQTTSFALTLDDLPFAITAGPDGALWFTLVNGARIGRVHPTTGALSAFSIRDTSNPKPAGITTGPDGNLWFTEAGGSKIGRLTPTGTMTQFDLLTANANPLGIAAGPDGNLWFTEMAAGKIGRITPTGVVTEFPLASAAVEPAFIAAGSDGNLWFTEMAGNALGRITPAGAIDRFPLADPDSRPYGIATGPDGLLWFTELDGHRIGRVDSPGVVTYFSPPTAESSPALITAGPGGALWFTEMLGGKVGKATTAGAITELALPLASAGPADLVAGADENLWFLEAAKSRLVRMATNGTIAEFPIVGPKPGVQPAPTSLTVGPDFNIWFTDQGLRMIGRSTPAGEITLFPIPKPEGSTLSPSPVGIVTGPDQSLWFTDYWGSRIGRMTIAGDVTFFAIPKPGEYYASPLGIAVGSDGNLWFTDDDNPVVSKMTTGGSVNAYPVPSGGLATAITRGSDGNLWFTERYTNRIGRITPGGTITEFPVLNSYPDTGGITAGSDGNLWFTERYGNGAAKLGRITPSGVVTEIPLPDPKAEPFAITTGPDGALWFTERVASKVGRLDPNQLEPPTPPAGEWLTSAELPGFQVKVQIAAGASPLVGHAEADCIADTLCVSGALPGRPEVFVRVVGPKPNGYLWPTLVKFSTSQIEVWVQQTGSGELRYYLLPAVDPGADLLNLAGLADKLGFESASAGWSDAPALAEPFGSGAFAAAPRALGIAARRVEKATSGPPPPAGPWLASPDLPGFLAKVRISSTTVFDGVAEPDCIDDTLCVSGALPGRPEVFVRVVGPKPNGYLWPTLVKFSTSQIEVWVEQESTGVVQYYLLPAVDAGADLLNLAGVADKLGFAP